MLLTLKQYHHKHLNKWNTSSNDKQHMVNKNERVSSMLSLQGEPASNLVFSRSFHWSPIICSSTVLRCTLYTFILIVLSVQGKPGILENVYCYSVKSLTPKSLHLHIYWRALLLLVSLESRYWYHSNGFSLSLLYVSFITFLPAMGGSPWACIQTCFVDPHIFFFPAQKWCTMGNQLTGIAASQILPVEHYLTDVQDFDFEARWILLFYYWLAPFE